MFVCVDYIAEVATGIEPDEGGLVSGMKKFVGAPHLNDKSFIISPQQAGKNRIPRMLTCSLVRYKSG